MEIVQNIHLISKKLPVIVNTHTLSFKRSSSLHHKKICQPTIAGYTGPAGVCI
jgi:hypothetical protein